MYEHICAHLCFCQVPECLQLHVRRSCFEHMCCPLPGLFPPPGNRGCAARGTCHGSPPPSLSSSQPSEEVLTETSGGVVTRETKLRLPQMHPLNRLSPPGKPLLSLLLTGDPSSRVLLWAPVHVRLQTLHWQHGGRSGTAVSKPRDHRGPVTAPATLYVPHAPHTHCLPLS